MGSSDETGEAVGERPVHPRELIAGIYELLGIDHGALMPNPRGLKVPVLPPPAAGTKKSGRLHEIL